MGRVNRTKLDHLTKEALEEDLWVALTHFKTPAKAKKFWGSFLTPSETVMLSKRLAVLRGVVEKKSYGDIKRRLKVASATVARAQNTLRKHGRSFAEVVISVTS